jgi:Flp pilus assembly protein TadG
MGGLRRQLSHLRRDDRGVQAVEFALIALPLMYLLYGAISFGFVLNTQETATQLAREGARAVAICASSATCDQSGTANSRVTAAKPAGFNVVSTTLQPSGGCTSATSGDITVIVETRPPLSFVPFLDGSTVIRGKATTPCGG